MLNNVRCQCSPFLMPPLQRFTQSQQESSKGLFQFSQYFTVLGNYYWRRVLFSGASPVGLYVCPSVGPSESQNDQVTTSSAVAKRPLDASCLSVVSFNSTKRRAQFLLLVT